VALAGLRVVAEHLTGPFPGHARCRRRDPSACCQDRLAARLRLWVLQPFPVVGSAPSRIRGRKTTRLEAEVLYMFPTLRQVVRGPEWNKVR
jgi:hypothetical protein